ncbi:protein FAM83G isoform X1 [Pantherophis guttatus]|uniref:Protein FAM83G isoform X1 n=1 Tax=Pantherophis guttatus TaxID=94885 RepID=A0A6P9DPG6_PANGU|nr:protein FAM83G isoform X1 [Pantherophis guttatus]
MAFSQVQCLDDSHVNWRSSESKPEFFYSEEQRLALEALVAKGPEAFYEVLKKENIRDFLSELELKKVLETLETYDPGAEYPLKDRSGCVDSGSQTDDQGPGPSLEYWPERSDRSIPQLDLGWPEAIAYRGVTRAAVYMQPPIDYQPHIKEVVRKMIFQAQKVIAVVMDMFTDVDIFKDLLDAGFRRKVAVYIIIDESNLKYFLQMCERAQMHPGHLKNLRIGTIGGTEFFTRSAMTFKGALAQKFMFVDGDKAVCGSYSFTWAAARTDRNVISVLSGQVVEAFDKQFQELYLMSRSVSLKSIPMGEEPEPEPVILPSVISLIPANSTVKKPINPKYALVKAKSIEKVGSGKASSDKVLTEQRAEAQSKVIPEDRVSERPSNLTEKVPAIHPGLLNLEKANMFDYLPTWVEPDPEPGSEILGYINIIDPKVKNIQLSQINRIKVCDVSKANAQHRHLLKQQKALEAKNRAGQEEAKNKPSQTSPPLMESAPSPAHEPPSKPLATSPMEKSPRHLVNGETIATLANNKHLKQMLDPQAEGGNSAAPVPKPRKVQAKDPVSKKTGHAEERMVTAEGPVVQQPGTTPANPSPKEGTPKVANAGNHLKVSTETAGTEEGNVLPMNGVQSGEGEAEEEEEEDYVTPSDHRSLSNSSPAHSCDLSNASIHSDKHGGPGHMCPLRRTNSDFLLNGEGPGLHHLQRKLSEPYISWGTFVSPLGSPPPRLTPPLEEAAQRRRWKSDSLEETRCVWERGHPLHALPAGYITCTSEAPQGPQLFCYGSRVQVSAERGKSRPQQRKSSEEDKRPQDRSGAKKAAPTSTNPLFWQRKNFTSAKNAQPGPVSHRGDTSTPRATSQSLTPLPEGQKSPKEIRTPLGIPLCKLSQSKHLKSKTSQLESKRKPPGTAHPKDQ